LQQPFKDMNQPLVQLPSRLRKLEQHGASIMLARLAPNPAPSLKPVNERR
jgi:hypothetical protein